MTPHLDADEAELRWLIEARESQARDEARHPSTPDGPWWFATQADREMIRGEL